MKRLIFLVPIFFFASSASWAQDKSPVTVVPSGELRIRVENRNDTDFNPKSYDRIYYAAERARAGILYSAAPKVDLFLQAQFTDYFGGFPVKANDPTFKTNLTGGAVPSAGLFEMHQGYLNFKKIGKSLIDLKVGRQEINLGDQRLIGSFDYSMLPRHFDGAQAVFDKGPVFTADAFAARASMGPVTKATGAKTSVNDPDKGRDIYGVYLRTGAIPAVLVDGYEIVLRDGQRGKFGVEDKQAPADKEVIYTSGLRVYWNGLKGLNVTGEYAVQNRHRYNVFHHAHAWAIKGYYKLPVTLTPGVGAESVFASGDRNSKDGNSNEFDNLFPTNHYKYGALDLFGWRNIRAQHAVIGLEPRKNLAFYIDAWTFNLPENTGPWKSASGAVVVKSAVKGSTSHYAGKEFDLTTKYTLSERIAFLGQLGKFIPGTVAVEQPGKHASATMAMAQVQANF